MPRRGLRGTRAFRECPRVAGASATGKGRPGARDRPRDRSNHGPGGTSPIPAAGPRPRPGEHAARSPRVSGSLRSDRKGRRSCPPFYPSRLPVSSGASSRAVAGVLASGLEIELDFGAPLFFLSARGAVRPFDARGAAASRASDSDSLSDFEPTRLPTPSVGSPSPQIPSFPSFVPNVR